MDGAFGPHPHFWHMVRDARLLKRSLWLLAPLGLYLLLVPMLAVGASTLGGHDVARIAQVILGVCSAAAWAFWASSAPGLSPRATAGVAALFVLALASVWCAADTTMALREAALLFGMAAITAVVAMAPDAERGCAWITSAASGLYATLVLGLAAAALSSDAPLDRTALFVGYDNHRFFNHVQTAAIPMALAAACATDAPRALRRLGAFALVTTCALLFASAGRGTIVALGVAALMARLLVGARADAVLRALGLALLAGFGLFALIFLVWPWLTPAGIPAMSDYAPGRIVSDQSRLYLWRVAWEQILSAPWFGIGPMHAAHWPNLKAAHPHNIYLQLAAEWGLPMLAVVVAASVGMLRRLVTAVRSTPSRGNIGVALLMGCLAVAGDGLVSGNFVMPVSQVWIAVLLGWALAWTMGARSRVGRPPAGMTFGQVVPGVAAATLVLQLWLAWSVVPEIGNLPTLLETARDAFPSERTQPRFWSHGRF